MEVRVNQGERHGESVVATHSCSVQSEMLNEAHAKKNILYLTRYSPMSGQAGTNFPPLVSTLYRIRKVSKP